MCGLKEKQIKLKNRQKSKDPVQESARISNKKLLRFHWKTADKKFRGRNTAPYNDEYC